MRFVTTTAVAAALAVAGAGFGAAPAFAKKAEAKPAGPDFSTAFRQAAQPLQTAVLAGDIAAAQAALPAAQTAASTPDDKYQLGIMIFTLGQKSSNNDMQVQGADIAIQSGKADPDTLAKLLDVKGKVAYNKGDLAGADQAFAQIFQSNPNDGDNAILLAQVKIREKQPQAAIPIIDKAIQAKTAANQPVPEEWYRRALSVAYDAKLPAETAKYGQMLVTAYPTSETWRVALQTYRDTNKIDQQSDLDTMRLMRAAHALAGERDYYEYANLANDKGYPGEAKAVIDEGMASNMVEPAVKNSKALNELKNLAAPKVAADKAALPGLDKSARAAADGKKALLTGDAYLGYGMYPQAADLFKLAVQKGGVDAGVANLRLGEALARSGQKDAALQAFGQVTGPRQTLAQYWTIWTNQGAAPAAAAAKAS